LCNRERLVTAWEVPMEGVIVEGVEGRDWVYNYLKPLETGEYEKLVPSGRKKVTLDLAMPSSMCCVKRTS